MGRAIKFKEIRRQEEVVREHGQVNRRSKTMQFFLSALVIILVAVGVTTSRHAPNSTPAPLKTDQLAMIITDKGEITVQLYSTDAPKTVANFIGLAQKGYYNSLVFHRVIKDFVIQVGDPYCSKPDTADKCGGGGESIYGAKFNDEINSHKIVAGTLAMANSGPNTNSSQFFIVTEKNQPALDGKYTVFGQVVGGMDTVTAIAAVSTNDKDRPTQDIRIQRIDITQ